jgi:site-specific recombinase XerD
VTVLGLLNRMRTDAAHGRGVSEGTILRSMSNLRALFTHSQGKTEENYEPISDLHLMETPSDIPDCTNSSTW